MRWVRGRSVRAAYVESPGGFAGSGQYRGTSDRKGGGNCRGQFGSESLHILDLDAENPDALRHGEMEQFSESERFTNAEEMRCDRREHMEIVEDQFVNMAGGCAAGLGGVDKDQAGVTGDFVEQREAHLGGGPCIDGLVWLKERADFASDDEADRIVGEDIIAESEDQDARCHCWTS